MGSYMDFVIMLTSSFYICSMCFTPIEIDYGQSCGEGIYSGICKKLSECPSGLQQMIQEQTHNLEQCGHHGDEEILCCPDFQNASQFSNFIITESYNKTRRRSNVDRKSLAACKGYNRYTPVILNNKVIAGSDAIIDEFPHMAQIGYQNSDFINVHTWECGASLIHPRFVLTAAHCVERADGIPPHIVRFGFINVNLPSDTKVIERLVHNYTVHPDFHRISKKNDIALIELSDEVLRTESVYPACLYQTNDDPSNLIITGWGVTLSGDNSIILQKAHIEPMDVKDCSTIYATTLGIVTITSNQICCLINNSMVDTCQGDSGGPLQILLSEIKNLYAIVGVTSYGVGCGDGKIPGVYTRISSYIDWIESIVWL